MILMSTVFNIEKMLGLKMHDINVYRIQHREHVKPCSHGTKFSPIFQPENLIDILAKTIWLENLISGRRKFCTEILFSNAK